MLVTTYPSRGDRLALPALYDRVHGLISERAALCLIELARRSYGPAPGSYGPLTVVVDPDVLAVEMRLPLWAVWPALEELAARELLVRRTQDRYHFDPCLALAALRTLGGAAP